MGPPQSNKISPLTKWVTAGMSLLMLAYGLFIIVTQHYYGSTTKYGGSVVTTDGQQAIIIGISIILIGLTPMALWAKSALMSGIWAGSCMILGIILFLAPYYIK